MDKSRVLIFILFISLALIMYRVMREQTASERVEGISLYNEDYMQKEEPGYIRELIGRLFKI